MAAGPCRSSRSPDRRNTTSSSAQVVGIHIDDRFIVDGVVDTAAMRPIARAGYREYFVATPETNFAMTRPTGGGDQGPL